MIIALEIRRITMLDEGTFLREDFRGSSRLFDSKACTNDGRATACSRQLNRRDNGHRSPVIERYYE